MTVQRTAVHVVRYDATCFSEKAAKDFELFLNSRVEFFSISRELSRVTYYSHGGVNGTGVANDFERTWAHEQLEKKRAAAAAAKPAPKIEAPKAEVVKVEAKAEAVAADVKVEAKAEATVKTPVEDSKDSKAAAEPSEQTDLD